MIHHNVHCNITYLSLSTENWVNQHSDQKKKKWNMSDADLYSRTLMYKAASCSLWSRHITLSRHINTDISSVITRNKSRYNSHTSDSYCRGVWYIDHTHCILACYMWDIGHEWLYCKRSLSITAYPFQGRGRGLEPLLAGIEREVWYTLDRSPDCHRTDT